MAREFDDASSQYLTHAAAILSATPITMACWFRTDDNSADQVLMAIQTSTTSNQAQRLFYYGSSADELWAWSRTASNGYAAATATITDTSWHHCCAVFAADNDRRCYLDGGNKGTNTSTKSPVGMDVTQIGIRSSGTPDYFMDGAIAHAAIWNIALTDEEVLQLSKGFSPLFIHPQNLVAYWPLIHSDNDWVGGYHMTPVNSPTWAAHPPVIEPASIFYSFPSVVAGDAMPMAMNTYRQRRD